MAFGASVIRRVQSEEDCGPQLYQLLKYIGAYLRGQFHDVLMTTDQVSSVIFDRKAHHSLWRLFERAVGLGLLFPNINVNQPDHLPRYEGTFHLAYVRSPHFRILPRRGAARNLTTMLRHADLLKLLGGSHQYGLFDGSSEGDQ